MTQLEILTALLVCIFEIYIFYDFHKGIFAYRFASRKVHLLILFGLTLSIFSVNQLHISVVNLLVIPCLLLIGSLLLYKGAYKNQILHVIIFYTIQAGVEIVSEIMFGIICTVQHMDVMSDPYSLLFLFLFEKLVALVILRLIKSHAHKTENDINSKIYKWVFTLPATTLLLFAGLSYSKINVGILSLSKVLLVIGCSCLLFVNALIFYLFEKFSQTMYDASEAKMQNLKLSLEHTHYDRVEEINLEHRKYLHDINHHLETIRRLVSQHQDEEALHVLEQMNQKFINIDKMEYCSHPILNAILCAKESIAKQKGICYEVSIAPGVNLAHISDYDLIAVVGNLIDNALEAVEKIPNDRYVMIDIFDIPESNSVVLRVENPCGDVLADADGHYISRKKDKEKHGIGLRSVADAVRENGGVLTLAVEDGVFVASVRV